MNLMLIGLTGLKGSGKSEVARILCREHGFVELAFAEPLKHGVMHMFGLAPQQVFGSFHEKEAPDAYWGVSPRELMQVVGTELMREELPRHLPRMRDVWIRTLGKRLASLPDARVVVSDVRFPDEVDFLRAHGGVIWDVVRAHDTGVTAHKSECLGEDASFQPDVHIGNHGSLEDLVHQVRANIRRVACTA